MAKWQAELAESRGMLAGTDMNNRPKPWKKKCEFVKADVVGKISGRFYVSVDEG